MKYRLEDEVTVKGVVYSDRRGVDGSVMCKFYAPNYEAGNQKMVFCVAEKDIATHTPKPRPIQAGDTVVVKGSEDCELKVLSVYDDSAWVLSVHNSKFTMYLRQLERIS